MIRQTLDMLTITCFFGTRRRVEHQRTLSSLRRFGADETTWFSLVGLLLGSIVSLATVAGGEMGNPAVGAVIGGLAYLLISGATPVAFLLQPGRLVGNAAGLIGAPLLLALIVANTDSAWAMGGAILLSYSLFSLQPWLAAPSPRTASLGPIVRPALVMGAGGSLAGIGVMAADAGVNGVLAGGMGFACGMVYYAMSVRNRDGYVPESFFGGLGCSQFVALATLLLLNGLAP
ncbi:MAG: hypothetical protein KA110_05395 [Acidimicrobiia bacterium]|nr:hypothetical protein [Acidimicrobiia bacterium]